MSADFCSGLWFVFLRGGNRRSDTILTRPELGQVERSAGDGVGAQDFILQNVRGGWVED
jgi:hypothetical protein